jgi:cytochrome P450
MRSEQKVCPINLSSPDTYFDSLPHDVLTTLRREAPVFWHEDGPEGGYWAVLKHADVMAVSRDSDTYSSQMRGVFYEDRREAMTDSLLLLDPPEHRQERRVVEPVFSGRAMDALEPWMRSKAREIMARAAAKGRCDFVYDLAAELPLAAICELVNVPEEERRDLLRMGDDVIRSRDKDGFTRTMGELNRYGVRLARQRAGGGDADLVSIMMRQSGASGLSEDEFGRRFAQIVVAANETTRTLLSCTALELMARPEVYRDLRADPSLVTLAVEEFLRWVTPIYYMRRTARRDATLRGARIREGDAVVMYYLSANRDEDVFDDPFRLDIRRRPNRHLSFGVGRHVCLGQFLARLEAKVFLEEFVSAFAMIAPAGTPRRLRSNTTNSWDCIPIELRPA